VESSRGVPQGLMLKDGSIENRRPLPQTEASKQRRNATLHNWQERTESDFLGHPATPSRPLDTARVPPDSKLAKYRVCTR
jgi:hypothetical protein